MADWLPDIPADIYNSWASNQFTQAVQDKISSLPSDIAQGVQQTLAPPTSPPVEPAPPAPEPVVDSGPPPVPPPPPEPPVQPSAPEAPVPAPTDTGPPPDLSQPAPPDLGQPTSTPAPAPPSPTPTPPSPTGQGFDPFGAALGAADNAGADVQQFASSFNQFLNQSGGDLMLAGINAAQSAGGDVQKFMDSYGSAFPQVPQQVQQAVSQTTSGLQGPTSSTPGDLIDQARQAAQAAGIDPEIFTRQIQRESGFNPNAKSGAGALGIAQFMPGTAAGLGIDPTDPLASLKAAAQMDAQNLQKYGGDWGKTLAAYNAGPGKVDKYGGVPPFQETQTYVQNILGGAKNVVQQAASAGQNAVNTVQDAAQSAVARTSQFAMGLSSGDAMAFCGPAAAMAFAETYGRNPTVDEAKQLAQQVGWDPSQGMAGPSSEVALLSKLGIDTHMTTGVNWQQVASDASAGNPVIIDTPGHYFYVDGYNAQTGQFHLGTSATDLKASAGQQWFTPDQIPNLGMGTPRAAIYADHPLSADNSSVASSQPQQQSFMGGLLDQAGNAASDLTQKAQDTLNAVVSTGVQTAQNLGSDISGALNQTAQDITNYTPPPSSQYQASTASPEAQQALSDILNYTPSPSAQFQANTANPDVSQQLADQFVNMLQTPGGIKSALATTLENTGDVPGMPGSGLLLDLLGNMLTGPSVLDNMQTLGDMYTKYGGVPSPDQMTPEDLQAYQQAQLGVVAATLPASEDPLAAGRAERVLNEAGQVLSTGGAPMQQIYDRTTGADLLQRAADQLGQYPEDIQQQVMDLVGKTNPSDTSQMASQIMAWVQQNPLSGAGVTNEAQQFLQAVEDSGVPTSLSRGLRQIAADNGVDVSASTTPADIVDALQSRVAAARGGNLPSGEMPGQLGLDLGELTRAQPSLPEGSGAGGVPSTALGSSDQQWLQRLQDAVNTRDMQSLQTTLEQSGLLGTRTPAVEGMLPGFEQGAQRALPEGAGAAGVPQGGLTGAETDWLSQLRQASAQRDFAGMADALQRAGLVGGDYRTGTYIPADIRYDAGGINQARMQGVLPGMSNAEVRPPVAKPAALAQPSGNLLSRLGQRVASAFSPTENLPAAARVPIQRFANMVGRQSDAISLMAHNLARDNTWDPQIEQSVRSQLYQKATRSLIDELQTAELAAPRASAPSGWKTGSSSANSTLSNYAFHPDVASAIRAVVDQSGVATNPLASSVMQAANTAKGTIFSLSNFHTLTEGLNAAFSGPRVLSNYARAFASDNFANGLRGSMAQTFEGAARAGVTGLNLRAENADAAGQVGNALWRRVTAGSVGSVGGAAAGYTEAKVAGKSDDEARNQAIMGGLAGAALAGVPMLRGRTTVAEALQSALWNRAVPIAKVTAWDGLTKGGLDPQVAANVVNERFGGLNYAAMGRNPAFMDATKMLIMAPDWGESTLRQLGSAIGGGAGQGARAGFLAKTLAGTMAVTELANYAMTGHLTNENQAGHQFEIEIQDPAGGYMHVGILPGNIQSVLSEGNKIYADSSAKRMADFQNLVTNRLSAPFQVAGTALEAATAKNSLSMPYGVSKAGPAAILANLSPIGISQVAQGVSSGGVDPRVAAVMALLGVNPRYTNPTSSSGRTPGAGALVPHQLMPAGGALAPAGGTLTPTAPLRPAAR